MTTDADRTFTEPGAGEAPPAGSSEPSPYVPIEAPDAAANTPMEQLVTELTADIDAPVFTLAVPGRPLYAVRYRGDLDGAQIDHARNASRRGSRKTMTRGGDRDTDIDGVTFTSRICIAACDAILRDGVELRDDKDRPFTFNHTGFMALVGAQTTLECVRLFYGRRDASIAAAADRIMGESGWSTEAADIEDVTAVDPPAAGSPS
jgi:hypothetical protein